MIARALSAGKHGPEKEGANQGALRIDSLILAGGIIAILLLSALMHVQAQSDQAIVSMLLGAFPTVTVIYPNGGEVINGTIAIVGDIIDPDGNDDIVSVNFSVYTSPCYGSVNTTELGFGTNTSQRNWSLNWNTSQAADSNDYYVSIEVIDSLSLVTGHVPSDDSDQSFIVNNIDLEPNWTEFKNNLSTNLTVLNNPSVLNDWIYVADLVLAKPGDGLINWTGQTLNLDNADLDTYIEISQGEVKLDDCGLLPFTSASADVHLYNIFLVSPIITKDGAVCGSCNIISHTHTNYANGTIVFTVNDWQSTSAFVTYSVKGNLTLDIWDQNDTAKPYANLIVYTGTNIRFFTNYSSTGGNLPESSETSCQIRFNTTLPWTSYVNMTYNSSTKLFEYNRTFSSLGNIGWGVACNSTLIGYYQLTDSDSVGISNRPPVLLSNYPDISMFEDTTAQGFDLDYYFYDPDGDALNYTALEPGNIRIGIDSTTHIPTYAPDPNFAGTRTSYFTATDAYGGSATSNEYTITVIDVPEAPTTPPVDTSAGAGGAPPVWCTPKWNCTEWSECKFKLPTLGEDFLKGFTGYQSRVCIDRSNCGYDHLKPDVIMGCHYKPTCFDFIKNQGEEGVDCGGPCPPCPSCFDKIRNQGEAGVDCGGPCPACPTCFDAIKNQGEEDIDCGGPCPACEVEVITKRGEVMEEVYQWLIWLMLSMVLVAVVMSMYYSRPYFHKLNEWFLIKMEGLTEVPVAKPTLLELELRTLARLQKLDEKLDTLKPLESSAEYVRIMRGFFRAASGLSYEFTYQELLKEFRQLKISATTLRALSTHFGKLSNIEFGKKALPRKELHMELIAARKHVSTVVRSLARVKVLTKEALKERAEKRKKLHAQKGILQFDRTLLQAERAIEQGRTDTAKALYNQLRAQYATLPQEERKQVLKRIKKLYTRISGRKPT